MIPFVGIYREPSCSPGRHRENDAIILEQIAATLERRGFAARLLTVEEAIRATDDPALVFSMCRLPPGLDRLARWERAGKVVVNRPDATMQTARRLLAQRMFATGVRLPSTRVIPTATPVRRQLAAALDDGSCWVKGGDLAASTRDDVQRIETMGALERVLDDFERRGIQSAILQEHIDGREIKFYAVGSDTFFHWLDVGDTPAGTPAPPQLARRASSTGLTLELEIFGGDVVIDGDGQMALIDLNDWPSFAPCRETAASAIASYLADRLPATSGASPVETPAVVSSPE